MDIGARIRHKKIKREAALQFYEKKDNSRSIDPKTNEYARLCIDPKTNESCS